MNYSLLAVDGSSIDAGYFTDPEPDGRVAVWLGAGLNDPARAFIGWAATEQNAVKLIQRLVMADRLDEGYGIVAWRAEDVADKYGITRQEAAAYLGQIEGHIHEAATQKGWELICDRRDEMPDARTAQQKDEWERAQQEADEQEADEQADTVRYW